MSTKSPGLLFILAVELLACKIQQDPNCKGINLPNQQEAKISQFADDTTFIARDTISLNCFLQNIKMFGNISGLKLNCTKTKAMSIGSLKDKSSKILNFSCTKDPMKSLEHISLTTRTKIMKKMSLIRPTK